MQTSPSVGIVGALPAALMAANDAMQGDPWALVTQLGIGGVLVAFAVWLQDKFATASRKDAATLKAEMAAERAEHAAEMAAERASHDETRQKLINALTKDLPHDHPY